MTELVTQLFDDIKPHSRRLPVRPSILAGEGFFKDIRHIMFGNATAVVTKMQDGLVGKVLCCDGNFARFIFHTVAHDLSEDKSQPLTVRHDIHIKIFGMERDIPFLQFLTVFDRNIRKGTFERNGLYDVVLFRHYGTSAAHSQREA